MQKKIVCNARGHKIMLQTEQTDLSATATATRRIKIPSRSYAGISALRMTEQKQHTNNNNNTNFCRVHVCKQIPKQYNKKECSAN